jgi:hypothetical protein
MREWRKNLPFTPETFFTCPTCSNLSPFNQKDFEFHCRELHRMSPEQIQKLLREQRSGTLKPSEKPAFGELVSVYRQHQPFDPDELKRKE